MACDDKDRGADPNTVVAIVWLVILGTIILLTINAHFEWIQPAAWFAWPDEL